MSIQGYKEKEEMDEKDLGLLRRNVNCSAYSLDLRENLRNMGEEQGEELIEGYYEQYIGDGDYEVGEDFEDFVFSDEKFLEIFCEEMLDENVLYTILTHVDEERFSIFMGVMEGKKKTSAEECIQVRGMIRLGLMFLVEEGEEFYLFVTDDVRNVVRGFDFSGMGEIQKRNREIYEFGLAGINLYGAISYEDLHGVYQGYYPESEITAKEMELVFKKYNEQVNYFSFIRDGVLSCAFYYEAREELGELLEKQKGKPRYVPSKVDEFLKYKDEFYVRQTVESRRLEEFFEENCDDETDWESVLNYLRWHFQQDHEIEDILRLIVDEGFLPERKKEQSEMLDLLVAVDFNSRKCVHNGYTAFELETLYPNQFSTHKLEKPQKFTQTEGVSKNGPCPCGSGKKYKRCCGK